MKVHFSVEARADLRSYLYHLAGRDPRIARSERERINAELARFAALLPADGKAVKIVGWPRVARRWYIHPFRVYFERGERVFLVMRLYHHARRSIER